MFPKETQQRLWSILVIRCRCISCRAHLSFCKDLGTMALTVSWRTLTVTVRISLAPWPGIQLVRVNSLQSGMKDRRRKRGRDQRQARCCLVQPEISKDSWHQLCLGGSWFSVPMVFNLNMEIMQGISSIKTNNKWQQIMIE